jgi:hypothetical protein
LFQKNLMNLMILKTQKMIQKNLMILQMMKPDD